MTAHDNDDNDGRHDFDYLHGRWRIRNRRLKARLAGCTDWEEFDATQECHPVLGGIGNVDHFHSVFPDGTPVEGMTVRIFDPRARLWSISWADNVACRLLPPVFGGFSDGRGVFHGEDVLDGKPIRVVFRWGGITADSAIWDQAFSADGGQTWETNWRMFMTREG